MCGGTFMLLLDTTIVNVALPAIQRGLGADFTDVQWVVDAYALTLAVLLLTAGSLADRFGRRLFYVLGAVVFTAGSLLCGLAQTPAMLILSRALQGVGASVMFATGLALLGGAFEGKQRGTAFGIWGMVTGLASALGPVVGGLLTSGVSWRAIFLVNLPIGAAVVAIMIWRVDELPRGRARKQDKAGFALFTVGLTGLVYGLIRAGETSWGDTGTLASLTSGVLLLAAFLITESVVAEPMLDLRLFRIPTFVGGSVAALAMNGSMFTMFLFVALYFQDVLGYSALETGVRLLIPSAAMLVSSFLGGRLTGRVPVRYPIGLGLVVVGLGLFLMGGISISTGWEHFIPGSIVAGLGAGLVNPPLASTAVGVVVQSRSGMASGINSTFRQVGYSASVAVLGSVFATIISNRLRDGLTGTELGGRAGELSAQVRAGDLDTAVASTPERFHAQVDQMATSGFVSGIGMLITITACIALAGGVVSLLLIRERDFAAAQEQLSPRPDVSEGAAAG
ncbi:MFS transporter [Streptomyces sp. NPDC090499]|uniref:MFS transporter n=1 Tax=Streptomyces sp. NPDC090499 TaxID=3365965 RepID=UPI0037FC8C42